MIKVKIADLVNSTETLQKLGQQDFKAKLAWSIARLLKAAETEIQGFNDARLALINKYGQKDENGNLITDDNGNCKIMPEDLGKFNSELKELINSEVEINANLIDMELLENIDFKPAEMANLTNFIKYKEDSNSDVQ